MIFHGRYTHPSNKGGGWVGLENYKKRMGVAKHFRLIRGELKVFSCFSWSKGRVETIFCESCSPLTAMFLLTYDLNSFKSRINKHLLSLGSF